MNEVEIIELISDEIEANSKAIGRSKRGIIEYMLSDGEYEEAFEILLKHYMDNDIDVKLIPRSLLIEMSIFCKLDENPLNPMFHEKLVKYSSAK
tara:strand:+ start:979 stop:1260 length:282 start_codon:yes stop_codon:yes gene_type:complete